MAGTASSSPVETPSGKNAGSENFPVGSILLPAHLRPHVATFYAFARTIDDIADAPGLSADEKIARLDGFELELTAPAGRAGYEKAAKMHASLAETGVTDAHCRDLVRAFKQDAVKNRYADWPELMAYCRLSAAPVGRYLVDLHGGSRAGYGRADALCNALQVINHRSLDRVYLPGDWMAECNVTVEELGGSRTSKGLRQVLDRCLLETASLMRDARRLPGDIIHRRLKAEAAVIVRLADALVRRLSRQDPLAARVKLTRFDTFGCLLRGLAGGLFFSR